MKKLSLIALFFVACSSIMAQSVEFTPIYGYTFSGTVYDYYGTFDVKDDVTFGGLLNVEIDQGLYVELSYQRINPTLIEERPLVNLKHDIGIEHYQIGAQKEFKQGQVKPFAELLLGTSRYFPRSGNNKDVWRFSGTLGLGAKVFFNDYLGIRLHTRLALPMEFGGAGIFCGIGGGCSGGVSFNVPLAHWELGGGLIIRLPN
ncbi:hypothetical protein [Labilibacter marinus]|uniref:hypothetical protein n=1 Tax=Labilibacter marinus TaxID=1477105 RepID=UPI000834ABCE|nr:hypothetical protein [Labilibacter marinus]